MRLVGGAGFLIIGSLAPDRFCFALSSPYVASLLASSQALSRPLSVIW